jgi:MarR family transcriptional regulator, negative regulator of the multidrug operon emrRAB
MNKPLRKSRKEIDTPVGERTADQAAHPHLDLMKKTAPRGTDRKKAGIGLLMLWLSDDITQTVNSSLAEYGVSEKKFDVLMLFGLAQRGFLEVDTLTPSYMSDYFGVTRSSVTGLLDWLENRQLLARRASASDRRSLTLELTKSGQTLLDQALPSFWKSCEQLVAALDEDECELLHKALGKIWQHLKHGAQ